MISYIRPPAQLVRSIVSAFMTKSTVNQIVLDTIARQHLKGTHFRFPKSDELFAAYRALIKKSVHREDVERVLQGKIVRTDSGVAPITVLTKPYPCPGQCVYCPTEVRMPKSYLASEPAAARALSLKFDPYNQVIRRVQMLEANGHEAKKIELIVKGGTWSAYPKKYREWFIKRCFDAANHLGSPRKKRFGSLVQSQKNNEKASYRMIGITIETRPDWVTSREIIHLRKLSITRVELGVQALDDIILKLTKRGHSVDHTVRATAYLKSAGFKVDYHFLPGQPGSSPAKDFEMYKTLFSDERFQPDMVKIYPCVVLPSAELSSWFRDGKFKPLEGNALIDLLIKMKIETPMYCRLSRIIRDFPTSEIESGNTKTNLRDMVKDQMRKQGLVCRCLRCREAGHQPRLAKNTKVVLYEEHYQSSNGEEIFLSFEDKARSTVLAFLRLRLPRISVQRDEVLKLLPELKDSAIIRELHTYGQALNIGVEKKDAVQHKGYGKRLMARAEDIAKKNGYSGVAVISGTGVREYYRALGYKSAGTYMRKKLN